MASMVCPPPPPHQPFSPRLGQMGRQRIRSCGLPPGPLASIHTHSYCSVTSGLGFFKSGLGVQRKALCREQQQYHLFPSPPRRSTTISICLPVPGLFKSIFLSHTYSLLCYICCLGCFCPSPQSQQAWAQEKGLLFP